MKGSKRSLVNLARVEVKSLSDGDALKANILKLLTDLEAKIQPEDAVVIYLLGTAQRRGNRFYLVPHDLGYRGNPKRLDDRIANHTLAQHLG